MTQVTRRWRAARRFCWLILLVCVTACGGGTTTGANTLARGVPQDEAMVDNDAMNGDGAGDTGQEDPENGDPAAANGEDDEKSLTVGGQL